MSAKTNNGIVVSGRPAGRIGVHGRLAILVGGVVVLLVLVGVGVYVALTHVDNKQSTSGSSASKDSKYAAAKTPTDKALAYANGGDYTGAQQIMSDQVSSATTPTDKASAYMQQAALAINAKKYADAEAYAEKAEAANPTDATAALLGQIALLQNDKTTAQKEYQLALKRLGPPQKSPGYSQRLHAYQSGLAEAQK